MQNVTIHRRKDRPAMIFFDKDGAVEFIDCGFGSYMPIEQMQLILEYAQNYIEELKTNDRVESLNLELQERRKMEQLAEYEKDRQERQLQKQVSPKIDGECFIYLMKDGPRGLHKIGKAKDAKVRLKQLKTANAGIELVAYYKGKESDEKIIHSVLEGFGKRISGEWFDMNEADIEYFNNYFLVPDLPF